ncbi:MAG: sugar phosphate isomerase/epimerase family protein [Phycisphaerales bacterium]
MTTHQFDRRSFLRLGAVTLALPAASALARIEPAPNRISLAEWSFHRAIEEGTLDPLDFPRAARRHGIAGVEYVNSFYRHLLEGSSKDAWVADLRSRCDGEGVQSLLIMCDGEGDLGHPDSAERAASVARHARWLAIASALGCHSIRVNARSSGTPSEQTKLLVDGLGALCDRAKPLGLNVLVENHGGQSSDGEWLASTLRAVGRPNMGALPDFGNFRKTDREWCDRYAGVTALAPLAKAMSAKSYDFDAAGNETTIDFARMLAIARAADYRGWLGIEYEGVRLSEDQGVDATKALLQRLGCQAV